MAGKNKKGQQAIITTEEIVIQQGTALTSQQEIFLATLLTGARITEAAAQAGVSRRTATYWMAEDHLVRQAYDEQQRQLVQQRRTRIQHLYDQALSTLEKALTSDVPTLRFQAAKYLLHTLQPAVARDGESLVKEEQKATRDQNIEGRLLALLDP